jgi:hypothetical protein
MPPVSSSLTFQLRLLVAATANSAVKYADLQCLLELLQHVTVAVRIAAECKEVGNVWQLLSLFPRSLSAGEISALFSSPLKALQSDDLARREHETS